MLYWGPVTTGVKKSHLLSHIGAVRYKTTHYIGVQWYNKSPPRTEWTLKVARLNLQRNFRCTLESRLPTFTYKI